MQYYKVPQLNVQLLVSISHDNRTRDSCTALKIWYSLHK